MTTLIELVDEVGNIDLCEVEPAPSTRIIRVVERIKTVPPMSFSDRSYEIGYQYACGYRD